ncbi:MAG: hypothetical protein ACJ0KA_11450 [Verrucomicrobiales bacterium]
MTRLAFQLSNHEQEFLSAASWIHDVKVVDIDGNPDAIFTDDVSLASTGKPILLHNSLLSDNTANIVPAFPKRFSPEAIPLKHSLDAGELGKLGLLRMHLWNQKETDGLEEIVQAIDLALWFFGDFPEHIHGTASIENGVKCLLVHLGFKCGGMALIDFTNSLPVGDNYESLCLIGSEGAAYADDHRNRNLFFNGGAPEAKCPDTKLGFMKPMLIDFVNKIKSKVGFEDDLQSYNNAFKVFSEAGKKYYFK